MTPAEDIKTRLDVVDVLGEYLPLKPAGSGAFKALCPFHSERTPSFHISRPRQSWHCFGCDTGGDIFSFVMKMEGMEFPEALELLANKAGVTLPAFDGAKISLRKRLYEVNDLAARFFRSSLLLLPQAQVARDYVAKRGVDDLTADVFRIGYAPDGWTNLSDALKAKGVTEDELLQAGLAAKREKGSGVYDRFRHRVMFTITDVHGNIVGFTGRILVDDKTQAKYVNTSETLVYKKSTVLYGLDKAKGEVRRQDLAVIVEGNMDVVSSHQFNVMNVVAASGTALTSEQLSLIKRFTSNLAIAFDQDAAGKAATLRGLDLARSQDFSIKIITLPPEAGKDPDEAVRKDPQIWRTAIAQAISIMEWVYRQAFRGRSLQDPDDKKLIAQEVLSEVRRIVDPVERDHWLKRLGQDLGVSEGALSEALRKAQPMTRTAPHSPTTTSRTAPSVVGVGSKPTQAGPTGAEAAEHEMEKRLLALGLFRPFLWQELASAWKADAIRDGALRTLYEACILAYARDNHSQTSALAADKPMPLPTPLTSDQAQTYDALAFLAEREFQETPREMLARELKSLLEYLRTLTKARRRKELGEAMRDAERVGDATLIAELARQFSELS